MNSLEFREIVPFFLDCIQSLGCNPSDIKKTDFDIYCKCPICGDSRTRKNLKRLHLYQKGDVINVNCFNGDCSVKNMTPYNFFKTYDSRIFEQFKQFYRRRFFDDIKAPIENKAKLESISASEDELFEEAKKNEVDDYNKTYIISLIENFVWTSNDEENAENFSQLVKTIKSLGQEEFNFFKSIIN